FRAVVRFSSGQRLEADLDADGTILGGRDLSADVPVKDLPAPVAEALRSPFPGGRLLFGQATRLDDEPAFEVVLRRRRGVTGSPSRPTARWPASRRTPGSGTCPRRWARPSATGIPRPGCCGPPGSPRATSRPATWW